MTTYISEKDFAQTVVETAEALGWTVWRTWRSDHSPSGEPDLRMAHPVLRRVIWAELKSYKGRLTAAQQQSIETLMAAGATVFIWRPTDWEEIESILSGTGFVQ